MTANPRQRAHPLTPTGLGPALPRKGLVKDEHPSCKDEQSINQGRASIVQQTNVSSLTFNPQDMQPCCVRRLGPGAAA